MNAHAFHAHVTTQATHNTLVTADDVDFRNENGCLILWKNHSKETLLTSHRWPKCFFNPMLVQQSSFRCKLFMRTNFTYSCVKTICNNDILLGHESWATIPNSIRLFRVSLGSPPASPSNYHKSSSQKLLRIAT